MSADLSGEITAIATAVLAAFAIITDVFAFLAYRKQSQEVRAIERQVRDQRMTAPRPWAESAGPAPPLAPWGFNSVTMVLSQFAGLGRWCQSPPLARSPPECWAASAPCPLPDTLHTLVCDTVICMAQVDRFSVTMPPELGEGVRQAAARQGTSVSTWLTEAAADKLRNELLGAALDQWEAEDGPFTQTELDEAASRLGLAPRSDVA
jgi:hypothetical protein